VVESAKFVVPFQGTESDCPVTQGGASLALGYRIWNPFRILSRLNLPVFVLGVQVPAIQISENLPPISGDVPE
jgi:hypothetical protein